MNDSNTKCTHQLTITEQTAISLTIRCSCNIAYLDILRLDPELDSDCCEGLDHCDTTIEFQVSESDAPELADKPDIYLLCRPHAAETIGLFILNSVA